LCFELGQRCKRVIDDVHHTQAEHDAGGEGLDAQLARAGGAVCAGVVIAAAAAPPLVLPHGRNEGRQHAQQGETQDDKCHAHARAAAGVHR
jgi:hypothetical protein